MNDIEIAAFRETNQGTKRFFLLFRLKEAPQIVWKYYLYEDFIVYDKEITCISPNTPLKSIEFYGNVKGTKYDTKQVEHLLQQELQRFNLNSYQFNFIHSCTSNQATTSA